MASLFNGFLVEKYVACQSRKSDFGWHRFRFSSCFMRKRVEKSEAIFGCFLVLRKLLFVSYCFVVWVLFSVFSVFCITYTSFGYCTRPQQCLFICTFTDKPTETRLTAPSKEAKEGEPFKITCTARANPTPVYQFYRDGKLIRRTSTGVLSFPSIKTEDAGTYRCVPTNEVGEGPEAIVTFTVTVKGKK